MESGSEITFRDKEWDAKYFGLILELETTNANRYEIQANELLSKHFLTIESEGATIQFKLTLTGCRFYANNPQCQINTSSWIRMGWGKSAKRKALPNFFASAEASVILNQME